MPSTNAELDKIDKKITALSDALAKLGSAEDWKNLLRIIRFPGWTTPAERALVHVSLDNMLAQTQALAKTKSALVKAAGIVKGQ
jgi:hypothetical protein